MNKKNSFFKKRNILFLIVLLFLSGAFMSCQNIKDSSADYVLVEPIRIVTTTKEYDAIRYESAYQIAKWWSELGLTVEVEPMEFRDLMVRIRDQEPEDKDWEAFMLLWTGRVERADPDMFIYSIGHSSQAVISGNNISSYKSEEYDALAEAQRRIADSELRRTVVHAAQDVLAKEIPYVTLFYRYIHSAYRNDLLEPLSAMAGEGLFHEWLPYYARHLNGEELNLVVAGNQEPSSLNPLTATTVWEWKLLRYMYDKLARVNQSFRPEPWAAESINYISDNVIEVILRPNMHFHDGMPVTAEDVKFSFEFMKEMEVAYFNAFLSPVKHIETAGEYKVLFTLHEPYAPFITMTLAQIPILPKHLWEQWALDTTKPIPMIGSGPLIFKYWQDGKSILFSRYDDYFAAEDIGIKTLEYMIYPSFDEIVESLKNGESHLTGAYLDPDVIPKLNSYENISLVQSPDIGFYIFGFNCIRKPFNDQVLREAVTRSMDLDYLVETIIGGYGDVGGAGQPISTGNQFWRNNQVDTYPFDIDEARKILQNAGYRWDAAGKLAYPSNIK